METLKDRLKKARLNKNLTQAQLAKLVGIQQQAVQRIEAGKVKGTGFIVPFAKALDVSPEWLQYGSRAKLETLPSYHSAHGASYHDIPIIDWASIKPWCGDKTVFVLDKDTKYLSHFTKAGAKGFALTIDNDAMVSSRSNVRSFYKGDILIVDPDAEVKNNGFVIAFTGSAKEAIFRQLVRDGGIDYLKPLNPQYPIIKKDKAVKVLGVVVSSVGVLA